MYYNLKKQVEEILSNREYKHFEADLIISSITNTKKADLILKKTFKPVEIKKIIKTAKKVKKGVPVQYLIKKWEFYGVSILVGKGVLIPRQDTETLVDIVLNLIKKNDLLLDLGTGSGCISCAIAKNKKNVKIIAVEKYRKAFNFAKKNLKKFKKTVMLIKGDILKEKFAKKFKNISLIVSNPPYLNETDIKNLQKEVKFEPLTALYGGKTGLKYYEAIAKIWKNCLKKQGYIVLEIGYLQKHYIEDILEKNGFCEIKTYMDLNKKDRVVVAKKRY